MLYISFNEHDIRALSKGGLWNRTLFDRLGTLLTKSNDEEKSAADKNDSTENKTMATNVVLNYLDSCTEAERRAIIAKYCSSSESDERERGHDNRTEGTGKSIDVETTSSVLVDIANIYDCNPTAPPLIHETRNNVCATKTQDGDDIFQNNTITTEQNINPTPQDFDCTYFERQPNTPAQNIDLFNEKPTQNADLFAHPQSAAPPSRYTAPAKTKKTNRNTSPCPIRTSSNAYTVAREPTVRRAKLKAKERITKVITDGRKPRKQPTQTTRIAADISNSKHHNIQIAEPHSLPSHTLRAERAADGTNLQQTEAYCHVGRQGPPTYDE
ncbi:unnamed protein product [Trichogramma brassicae]|uniref:Uncharacterized protein n=1 Tax=Trichogramma brassicae TaxID=86971 RepID=A0A6H5IUG3_9HYME|nr:unnamed protein product [Trichogramma brassicae]